MTEFSQPCCMTPYSFFTRRVILEIYILETKYLKRYSTDSMPQMPLQQKLWI